MLSAQWEKHTLHFKQAAGTSRGVLKHKDTWIIKVKDESGKEGVGECNMFRGLSYDDRPNYEDKLNEVCSSIQEISSSFQEELTEWPSIRFGMEGALISMQQPFQNILFPSAFTNGNDSIPINGLIWMGSYREMRKQLIEKIKYGFRCIKLKIGAISFEEELNLIKSIRNDFNKQDIEIRLDANGAFSPHEALEKLKRLSAYTIHSIEQPIRQGQWEAMAGLCESSPIKIALDEELIGITSPTEQQNLLKIVRPHFIILKPTLVGGFLSAENWINLARKYDVDWWVTSALESNIGLNAISQWTYTLQNPLPQGLGTGGLFTNNFPTKLSISNGKLYFNPGK